VPYTQWETEKISAVFSVILDVSDPTNLADDSAVLQSLRTGGCAG
jgi:hypothetical protein